jgi:phosphoribosylformimino-5-aminoimidazole carboxamide ribotide isomerase
MDIIPVIDVRHGVAVRAVAGDRASYRPLETPLAESTGALDVARGYLALYPFKTLYVADLDGIESRGRNDQLLARLVRSLPGVTLWVDDGSISTRAVEEQSASTTVVIGSESLADTDFTGTLAGVADHVVLSLDFRGDAFLGPPELLRRPELWPGRVIVMTLSRVGSAEGPDLDRIEDVARRARQSRVYAAGGIRGRADLEAARDAGAAGALVATALHAGKLKAGDLEEIAGL